MRNNTLLFALIVLANHSIFSQSIQLIPASPNVPWIIGAENAGDERIFIIRQDGFIVIRTPDAAVLPTPFLDWSSKIKLAGEQGLLGLAFHPNYAANGQFYIYYSQIGTGQSVLSRLTRSAFDPQQADPNTEQVLLSFPHDLLNHVGGSLKFGADGYLYLSSGDGATAGDIFRNAQNNQLFLGKILRIDVDGGTPYAIPPDNPFVGNPNYLPEIWCNGLRNPWRMSFDRLNGDAWIGDVGQDQREEINIVPFGDGGLNFGWSCKEGTLDFNLCPDTLCCFTPPLYEYDHKTTPDCSGSITGGYVYRGYRWNDLWGRYIFTDFCTGEYRALDMNGGIPQVVSLGTLGNFDVSIAEDNQGELYVASYGNGKLFRIESQNCAPVARIVGVSETIYRCQSDTSPITLSAYGGEMSGMNFQWYINNVPQTNETSASLTINQLVTSSTIRVMVSNPINGCSAFSNTISIFVQPGVTETVDTTIAIGQVFQDVTIQSDTTFFRSFIAYNGCDSTVKYTVSVLSAVSQPTSTQLNSWVSPNPSVGLINLHINLESKASEAQVGLYDTNGKSVQKFAIIDLPAGESQHSFSISDLPAGMYALRIQIGQRINTTRLIRQ